MANEQSNVQEAVVSLAFRVKYCGDGLYAHEMIKIEDDIVVEKREGVATTLGHAIAAADELLDGWAFGRGETRPEDFFKDVLM